MEPDGEIAQIIHPNFIEIIVSGNHSLELALRCLTTAALAIATHNRPSVLIDITGVKGRISALDLFDASKEIVYNWPEKVRMAFIARNDQGSFDSLFVNALGHWGIQAQRFAQREQAVQWLGATQS